MLDHYKASVSPCQVEQSETIEIFEVMSNFLENNLYCYIYRMDYTKDLSANVLFLLLKKASNLEKIVGTETWPGLNKRF